MQTGDRIAFNTFMMYAKALITFGITVYSTRLILNQLGVDDYGTYNVVAGIVGMLEFLVVAISMAGQRYMSYAIGKKDMSMLCDVYRITKRISLIAGIIAVVISEIFCFCFLSYLNISPERLFAAQIAFQCVTVSVFFSIISITYHTSITVHEDIFVISLFYIVTSILKLGIAFYLIFTPFDKLIVYGALLAAVYTAYNFALQVYCRKYEETRIKPAKKPARSLFREIAAFSGWTSFEPVATIFSTQGVNVLLNLFGGVVFNAAYGIANQVNGQMNYFSTSLLSAMNPQIMKSEGGGDRPRTAKLSMFACKISFFMMAFFALPLIAEMPYVLRLWLKNVPDYTVLFCRLILVGSLISQLTFGLQSGLIAIGSIRKYLTATTLTKLLTVPAVYLLLKNGMSASLAVAAFIFIETVNLFIRLYYSNRLLGVKYANYLQNVFIRLFLPASTVYLLLYFSIGFCAGESFFRLIISVIISSLSLLMLAKLFIFNREEFQQLRAIALKAKIKILGIFKK
ncbi:MAG: hypothetical protein LBR18_04115 [Tannerella sp.]|jgi:Na+-driven multidrug efflux pump|nr:hypothetical protein [Tannerella sp.]